MTKSPTAPDSISEFERRRSGDSTGRSAADLRDGSERDYARVVHSSSFRRLQNKMQVFPAGDGDFYRTRLTHSLETAQIGAGIVAMLAGSVENEEALRMLPEPRQIEAVCLAHDLGNPPFGHGGERMLDRVSRTGSFDGRYGDKGGFEGNGQTLRILTKLDRHTEKFGLDLTRRTLLGVVKYPAPYSAVRNPDKNDAPPKCFLDSELDVFEWLMKPFSRLDRKRFSETTLDSESAHSRTLHKSLDASLMETADDIAYGVHDFEDAVKLKLVSRSDCDEFANAFPEGILSGIEGRSVRERRNFFLGQLTSDKTWERKYAVGELVHYLMRNVVLERDDGFEHSLLAWNARLSPEASEYLGGMKRVFKRCVVESPVVQARELKGMDVVERLYGRFVEHPGLLDAKRRAEAEEYGLGRAVCDYVGGMTDEYAAEKYAEIVG